MTNSPTFDKQLALAEYWKQIGGTVCFLVQTELLTVLLALHSISMQFQK